MGLVIWVVSCFVVGFECLRGFWYFGLFLAVRFWDLGGLVLLVWFGDLVFEWVLVIRACYLECYKAGF